MHTIGKLAQQAEVTTDTVRYYEKEGLLVPTRKTDAGYRLYDENAVRRLRFIRQAQECSFSLAEIRDLPRYWELLREIRAELHLSGNGNGKESK